MDWRDWYHEAIGLARKAEKERDELQAALAEQIAENDRLTRKLEEAKAALVPWARWE
jgi:hypothetical protein